VKNGGYARSFLKSYYDGPTTYNTTRSSSGSRSSSTGTQADAVFTYVRKINSIHNFDTKLGFSYYDSQSTSLSAGGRDAANRSDRDHECCGNTYISKRFRNLKHYFMDISEDKL
jgi:hypothetical protein